MNQNQTTQPSDAVSARPQTQVENELNNLSNVNKHLLEQCHTLRDRLRGVLRQRNEKDAESPVTPRVMLVPLAEHLRGISDMTVDAIKVLEDIGQTVELPYFD
jgi:hypothetical protein